MDKKFTKQKALEATTALIQGLLARSKPEQATVKEPVRSMADVKKHFMKGFASPEPTKPVERVGRLGLLKHPFPKKSPLDFRLSYNPFVNQQ